MTPPTILFVCTGNICRSPMAEYLLRHQLPPGAPWTVSSAGMAALPGFAASPEAVQALREIGIDLSPHRSRPLSRELVDSAAMIVVMSGTHREQLKARYPNALDRVFLLKRFDAQSDGGDVFDPIGMPVEVYRAIRDEITASLPGLMAYMAGLY